MSLTNLMEFKKEVVMREQRQDEDRFEYDGAICDGPCLAYDIATEVRARGRV